MIKDMGTDGLRVHKRVDPPMRIIPPVTYLTDDTVIEINGATGAVVSIGDTESTGPM
jgi:hypothetical protein